MQFRAGAAPRWHRYASRDFRQRQLIRRQAAHGGQRYAALLPSERLALLAASGHDPLAAIHIALAGQAAAMLHQHGGPATPSEA